MEKVVLAKIETKNNKEWAEFVINSVACSGFCALPTKCKNCLHNNPKRSLRTDGIWCDFWGTDPDPDDFCIKGEPKEMEVK